MSTEPAPVFDDSGSRARHPSSGIPADPHPGGAGTVVPASPPWGGGHQLRKQRRQIFYAASVITLLLALLATFAPVLAGWVGGVLLAAVLWAALTFVLWAGAFEIGHYRARRRARRFDEHTDQALHVDRRHPL